MSNLIKHHNMTVHPIYCTANTIPHVCTENVHSNHNDTAKHHWATHLSCKGPETTKKTTFTRLKTKKHAKGSKKILHGGSARLLDISELCARAGKTYGFCKTFLGF